MTDEHSQSRVERLKAIYRDFFAEFLSLSKRKNQILNDYESALDAGEQANARQKIDSTHI